MTNDGLSPEGRSPRREKQATVLVADDSSAVRRILRRALESGGYRVTEAADGEQALRACRADPPDLLLLDIDMPVMDGLTTLGAMKADPQLVSLPVLFLTARTTGADLALGLERGAEDYLRKPCDPAELQARIAHILRLRGREDDLRRRARESDELSAIDPLTGLGNRRHLDLRVRDLAASRDGEVMAGLIIVDIDHFKDVNDSYGHLAGDEVLKTLAARFAGLVDRAQALVRWEQSVRLADEALYEAKRTGRTRVLAAWPAKLARGTG